VRQTAGGQAYDRAIESAAGPDEEALAVLHLVIGEVLAALPASHRPIVELRIVGHEVAEIARQVQRSKRSVERILQGFRQRLDAQIREGD
jgi:DNA-directed RNA polymerase specialized sigma24 family protein